MAVISPYARNTGGRIDIYGEEVASALPSMLPRKRSPSRDTGFCPW